MATPTYDLLDSTTLSSSASSVTFSSIDQSYRDLEIVISGTVGSNSRPRLTMNGDTGANYSWIFATGNGSSASSNSGSSQNYINFGAMSSSESLVVGRIMDYSATDKHKSTLGRGNGVGYVVQMDAGRYASTSAITSITLTSTQNFQSGTTFYLYGVAA